MSALRRTLFQLYWRLESLLAPGLRYSQLDYERLLEESVDQGCRWLDLGCGHRLLPEWRGNTEVSLVRRAGQLVGIDPELAALRRHVSIEQRCCGDASHLPFESGVFDLVTANMVVEHLRHPAEQFREVHRVLRPGGRFVFHTPNRYGHAVVFGRLAPERLKAVAVRLLEGRAEDDRFRTYYRANSAPEIAAVAEHTGFALTRMQFVASTAAFAMVPPLAIPELLWIRQTIRRFPSLRSNLLVVLERAG